jgi:hypothetical protein
MTKRAQSDGAGDIAWLLPAGVHVFEEQCRLADLALFVRSGRTNKWLHVAPEGVLRGLFAARGETGAVPGVT